MVSRLTDAYTNIGIHHGDSLPMFYKARSMFVLIESLSEPSAFLTTDSDPPSDQSGSNKSRNSSFHGGGRHGGNWGKYGN